MMFVDSNESVESRNDKKTIPKSDDFELSETGISVTNYKKSEAERNSRSLQGHDNMAADFSE